MKEINIWDLIVIGGGPAGMMAASTASESGAKVLLIEKNKDLGQKLLITGGGRCNITNAETNNHKLLAKFKNSNKFLFSAFSQWGVKETLNFFHSNGVPTKIENELRVFPVSNKAESVWTALVEKLDTTGVIVLQKSPVTDLIISNNEIKGVITKNGKKIYGKSIVIATGGTSRPETGSTGDAYDWLRKIGHTINEPEPSLVPLKTKEKWTKTLSGVTLQNIKITILQNQQKQNTAKGKILFTHIGVTGPTILNMSKDVSELLKYGEVTLSIDLRPDLDHGELNFKLQEEFRENHRKKLCNTISNIIPKAIVKVVTELSNIDRETKCNSVSREDRIKIINTIKNLPIQISGLLGVDKAIITSGGVSTDEVDFKTMRSKLHPNLYLVGDILDIDRPSGGYSLQLCWTTGFVAGKNVVR